MAASAITIANGAAGLTGLTRAEIIATLEANTSSVDVTIPNTFIPLGILNGVVAKPADGSAVSATLWYDTTNTKWVLKFSAAPGAGKYRIIVIGELGRRDVSAENPNYAGNP